MAEVDQEHDLLKEIPSPSARLWVGLCIILSIFVVYSGYSLHELEWLEDFQGNVVQKNRKASLQLLRLQNDAYLLALSLREMAAPRPSYPIADWRAEFTRLRRDMEDAVNLESQNAVTMPAADEKRAQLRVALGDFWNATDRVFGLAAAGREGAARESVQGELEGKRATLAEIVARLLVLNDQAQAQAAETISSVYGNVKRDILIVIGLLFFLALATGLYTLQANRKTFRRLQHLAEQLRTQSEQLRTLYWKLIDVQEETLRQVARDLHDEFGQILTAIGAMLGRARHLAPTADSFLRELEAVRKIVEDTLQNIRDRSQMFRPAILDDFGLDQALEWFVAQFSRQTGIHVHFDGKLTQSVLPAEDAVHLYRIVQESLNNVARHAGAREAWVKLSEQDGELRLEIRDNGAGFETAPDTTRAGGVGLMGMQERAEHLGGSLSIHSSPGQGTIVDVRVPIRGAERQARAGSRV